MNVCRRLLAALLMCAGSALALAQSQQEENWRRYMQSAEEARPAMRFPYQECFERVADRHDLPLTLLLAVARGESDFKADAKSSANAYGVMQIQWPGTANDLGIDSLEELLKPCANIDAGARYLKWLMPRYSDNVHRALAAYNYGPGKIQAGGSIPDGAQRYSGYIYDHLQYVLGRDSNNPLIDDYAKENKQLIYWFERPYQARGFVKHIDAKTANVRLDIFRRSPERFEVRLLYVDDKERRSGIEKIEKTTGLTIIKD